MEAINFINEPFILFCVSFISWPIYKVLAKVFFGEQYQGFAECFKYAIQCDFYSMMQGKYWDDYWATLKLNTYLSLCIGWVCAVAELICRLKIMLG